MSKEKDPARVKSGKKSKRKGSSFELQLSKQFKTWWGTGEWARSPGSGGWARGANREGFGTHGDIITTDKTFPFCVEAKSYQDWSTDALLTGDASPMIGWWKQAAEQCPSSLYPLLVMKKNNCKPLVVFAYSFFPDHNVSVAELMLGKKSFKVQNVDPNSTLMITTLSDFFTFLPELIALEGAAHETKRAENIFMDNVIMGGKIE